MRRASVVALVGAVVLSVGDSRAQAREPLCRNVETRRVSASASPAQNLGESVLARPLLGGARGDARFVLVWREWRSERDGGSVARIARVGEDLRRVGAVATLAVSGRAGEVVPLAIAALPDKTLVFAAVGSGFFALSFDAAGAQSAARELVALPDAPEGQPRNRVVWATATERADGAVLLAGALDGSVRAYRFDRQGDKTAETTWTQRVGGAMRLLPTGEGGPVAALLHRPLPGVGPNGEEPAVQMLVTLDDRLLPVSAPERTGFAQYPFSAVTRGSNVELAQWVGTRGVAIGSLPVSARRVALGNPRLWFAQPPFLGGARYAAGLDARDGVSYALVIGDRSGNSVESHLAWIPPSGEPMLRRNVVPVFGTVLGAPAMLPAADGFVAVVAHNDESGFALDAYHVRCELVRRE